jgi:hypothetical protein
MGIKLGGWLQMVPGLVPGMNIRGAKADCGDHNLAYTVVPFDLKRFLPLDLQHFRRSEFLYNLQSGPKAGLML